MVSVGMEYRIVMFPCRTDVNEMKMRNSILLLAVLLMGITLPRSCFSQNAATTQQLKKWLKQFPAADTDGNGVLTDREATAYRKKMFAGRGGNNGGARESRKRRQQGAPREFQVDAGWNLPTFPEHAVSLMTAEEIKKLYSKIKPASQPTVRSFPKPSGGNLRVVGTGHSFMAPGYKTLPLICKAGGLMPMLYTHTGGGITGSARYKWEQENGIFQFDGAPVPKLLASIANAEWDAMMFGPYFNDKPKYYSCWIDFCLKNNPSMKFYLSDAWPQLYQLGENPKSEEFFTAKVFDRMGAERRASSDVTMNVLRDKYPGKVFILPTSDAMVLAAKAFLKGELPGIEGIHKVIGKKERSLWRDQLGHLGPGFERLEGYVFYATLYGKSPERIKEMISFDGSSSFPSKELDRKFREIAWQAVAGHSQSGVKDENADGLNDEDSTPILNEGVGE